MLSEEQVAARARSEADAETAVVSARWVGARGELSSEDPGTAAARDRARVVVTLVGLTREGGGRIVPSCPSPSGVYAHRIVTDLGVLDVTEEGLVVREVAAGVSALDVQRTTDVTLLVGPDLRPVEV